MVRLFAFVLAGVIAFSTQARALPTQQDLVDLTRLFAGEFDNHDQYRAEERAGIPESERHTEVYAINKPVALPAFGDHVFYIEEYRDADPANVIRQRIASFEIDAAENAVRMKLYFIKDDKAVRGAHLDPGKLAGLTKDNTNLLPGCDVFWTRDADIFNAVMKEKACVFSMKPDEPKRAVRYMLTLTEQNYQRVDRSLYVNTDKVAGGRSDDLPSVHKRVTSLQ